MNALLEQPATTSRTQESDLLTRVVVRATTDPEFRRALLADPGKTLADAGIDLPDGFNIQFVERPSHVDLLLPLPPLAAARTAPGDPELESVFVACDWWSLCWHSCVISCIALGTETLI